MPQVQGLRPSVRANHPVRYLATRPESPSTGCYVGETVEEVRFQLERSAEPGRYRVFDRRPATRGIESELVGQFVVEAPGEVQWRALPAL